MGSLWAPPAPPPSSDSDQRWSYRTLHALRSACMCRLPAESKFCLYNSQWLCMWTYMYRTVCSRAAATAATAATQHFSISLESSPLRID
mmetsp:Transcript_28086/g.61194  ORF Transcript_28086/g.61194 Transcript_28086/m.61194 type:complete len:89 (-) Transcript_28086:972-1238(-)